MIDNIILLITGTLHQRPISELVPKCHKLGSFEQMEAIHVAATPAELYNAVLVDTPLAPFFEECINEQDLDEMNIEIIRNTLYKSYLESFYNFCKNIGGETEVGIFHNFFFHEISVEIFFVFDSKTKICLILPCVGYFLIYF